jgi:hypothetical protein
LQDVQITLLDILWLAIAYGKANKRTDAIESMCKSMQEEFIEAGFFVFQF